MNDRVGQKEQPDAGSDGGSTEYRLRERERFLRTLIGNLPGVIYRCRADEQFTSEFISEGLVGLSGYEPSEIIETRLVSWDDIIHPEDRERVRDGLRRLLGESPLFDNQSIQTAYRIKTKSGETRHVRDRARPILDWTGRAVALEGFITDITERTLADERLRETEGRYRLLAENIKDLVCLHDRDGHFIYVSPSSSTVLGYEPKELIGKSPYDFIHPADAPCFRADAHELILQGDDEVIVDYRMRCKSGKYTWLESMVQPITDEAGELVRLLSCSRDISKRKEADLARRRAEEELAELLVSEQQARREADNARLETERAHQETLRANRAKDEFLQMVSHEFRTPLTTIKTAVRVLRDEGVSEAEREEYLDTIAAECDRQIDMIVNLLDVSRIEENQVDLKYEPVDVSKLLRQCDRIERGAVKNRRQTLTFRVAENLPAALGDLKALRRALCTIIENSIKYTPEEGVIEVRAEMMKMRSEEGEMDEAIAVVVEDNGRGILPEDLPHVFEKFYRGKKTSKDPRIDGTPDDAAGVAETPGVGLGLYLAKRIVTELGGRIEVWSKVGQGTRLTVLLQVWSDERHKRDSSDAYNIDDKENHDEQTPARSRR